MILTPSVWVCPMHYEIEDEVCKRKSLKSKKKARVSGWGLAPRSCMLYNIQQDHASLDGMDPTIARKSQARYT